MTNKVPESSSPAQQGETPAAPGPQPGQPEHQGSLTGNTVSKSGALFISSKGIGWTSWKKRWFILTSNSLVFYRSDPNAAPQKNSETNLPLGGIDLNNSGSVEVKPDKKLLNVLFPDGRDGRAFTLKAETSEDLYEWKNALEAALAQAPSATAVTGQNGILSGQQAEAPNGSSEQQKDRPSGKSMVIGRPVLLALKDFDGSPSFLEKALKFIEDHGVRTEGILRQAADVEEVERRVYEYEHGKTEFSCEEDAHVIADCIKHVLRELPSPPVPASCCNALLEAYRTDRGIRVNAMRTAVLEAFPEPNRKLLQRILVMMQTVASHKAVNRMGTSAVAACMAPLLLRPLLAGDCEVENQHMNVAGDNSFQLLQAAAAANHAQAIIIMLLDDYRQIFGNAIQGGSLSHDLFSKEEEQSGSEEETEYEDDEMYEDEDEDEENEYGSDELDEDEEYASDEEEGDTEDGCEFSGSEICGDSADNEDDDLVGQKSCEGSEPVCKSHQICDDEKNFQKSLSASSRTSLVHDGNRKDAEAVVNKDNGASSTKVGVSGESVIDVQDGRTSLPEFHPKSSVPQCTKSATTNYDSRGNLQRTRWGRTSAKKKLSMESFDFSFDEEEEIKTLEATKQQLELQIAEEAKGNEILQASLEGRKKALHERRLALEIDVVRLQEQLQNERDLRAALDAGLSLCQIPISANMDEKVKRELMEIAADEESINSLKQRVDDLGVHLNQQRQENYSIMRDRGVQLPDAPSQETILLNKQRANEPGVTPHNVEKSTKSKGQSNHNSNGADDGSSSFKVSSNPSVDAGSSKPIASSTSKKCSSKGEGSSTNFRLSKLTTRLNFLKERRTQIANELQNLDIGQSPSKTEKGKESEAAQNTDRKLAHEDSVIKREENESQSQQNSSNKPSTEDRSSPHEDETKRQTVAKTESLSHQDSDKGKSSEGQSAQHLDRLKSSESKSGQKRSSKPTR